MNDGVVAVFAHPDDESLLAGGALAGCAAAGLRVAIVSLTRGERGPSAGAETADRAALAKVREAELMAAADALGAASSQCLDYPDGELEANEEQVAEGLAALLERERPAAVIGFSAEGLYWHPDHIAASRSLAAGLELLGRDGQSVWSYGATWPDGHASRLASLMRDRGLPTDLWGIEPDAFGAPADAVMTSVNVSPFLRAKMAALSRYRSQIGPDHLLSALPADLAEEFLGREFFVRIAPKRARDDWLTATLRSS